MTNLELKARLSDLVLARCTATELGATAQWKRIQTDTYFVTPDAGRRLKLREYETIWKNPELASVGRGEPETGAELIAYARANITEVRASDYLLYPTSDPAGLKAALAAALGLRLVVRKTRELLLYHNVRIHLDEVDGLGVFLEFEAALSEKDGAEVSEGRLELLRRKMRIEERDLVAVSYSDLLDRERGK
jgi:adenylate cyclase class IV